MSVEALAPICNMCPDLDITVTQLTDGYSVVSNYLECTHYQRCLRIKETIEKERDSKNE
jgi:hypothetical protein